MQCNFKGFTYQQLISWEIVMTVFLPATAHFSQKEFITLKP